MKQTVAIAVAMCISAPMVNADDTPDYLRSSLYTLLIKSDAQNQRLDEENAQADGNALISIAKSFAGTDAKKSSKETSTISLASIPSSVFTSIAIPAQFNDHNLAARIIDFDALRKDMTEEQVNAATEKFGMKKKSGLAKFGKGAASSALGAASGKESSSMVQIDDVDEYTPAVLLKYLEDNNLAARITARWFDYDEKNSTHWDINTPTLNERGLQSLSINEQNADNTNKMLAASQKAINLIPNTFVIATNLRFRSNKAILAEAQALADAVGSQFGGIGKLAAMGAGAAASSIAGDGFSVQAVSHLFRLVWNEDVEYKIGELVQNNGSLEDLIQSGVCHLEYVGKEKAGASVRQSIFSDKPISDLVNRATTRAIDASIAKLQEKNEVFRSIFPISSVEPDGSIKVKIGTREGVSKNDTYAILEKVEDEKTGKISYKEIASVKPDENLIWNNVAGAEEELAENKAKAEGQDKEFNNDTVTLGATTFKGKKGKDYSGCFIQLKKKK